MTIPSQLGDDHHGAAIASSATVTNDQLAQFPLRAVMTSLPR
jgi:hypothetical protein